MRADWGAAARNYITVATRHLPDSASLTERRAALRRVGTDFHMGTSWGKKVWTRECRKYLERHGLPPKSPQNISQNSKLYQRLNSGDVTFPFKGGKE